MSNSTHIPEDINAELWLDRTTPGRIDDCFPIAYPGRLWCETFTYLTDPVSAELRAQVRERRTWLHDELARVRATEEHRTDAAARKGQGARNWGYWATGVDAPERPGPRALLAMVDDIDPGVGFHDALGVRDRDSLVELASRATDAQVWVRVFAVSVQDDHGAWPWLTNLLTPTSLDGPRIGLIPVVTALGLWVDNWHPLALDRNYPLEVIRDTRDLCHGDTGRFGSLIDAVAAAHT